MSLSSDSEPTRDSVEHHGDRLGIGAELEADRNYELAVFSAEVHGHRDEVEGDRIGVRRQLASPEGLGALAVAGLALEGAVHHRAAIDRAPAVFPAECDVEHHVHRRE
jgi:hypothetical protein